MESSFDDDIDIIRNGDIVDGHSQHKSPEPLVPKFYVGTAELAKDSASHLALQQAYSDLKNRYNGLAQKFRERTPRSFREVEISDMSRETTLDDCYPMPSMAQAAGAEMPEMASEHSQMNSYLQRQLMQTTTNLNRLQVENKSLKNKLIDMETKYKHCLREKDQLHQDLETLTEKNQLGRNQETELLQSRDKLISELKNDSFRLDSELLQAKQAIFERDKMISDLSRKWELAEKQMIENRQSNYQRENQELMRTQVLLSEREQELSELKKQYSQLSADVEQRSHPNAIERLRVSDREQLTKSSLVEAPSVLEDVSLLQINQNEEIIRNLQKETKQQASIITKLFEQVSAKQNSLEPTKNCEPRGAACDKMMDTSSRRTVPLTGSDLFKQQHMSQPPRETTSREFGMDYSVAHAVYPASRTITIGSSPRSPVMNGINDAQTLTPGNKYNKPDISRSAGSAIRQEGTAGSTYLKNQGGLVSFNIGSPGRVDSTNETEIRNPSEHSDNTVDSHSPRQYNYPRPIDSQILPLSTHQSVQNSASVGTNFNLEVVPPTMTNDSMFRDSSHQMFAQSYSTERLSDLDRPKGLLQVCPICSLECSNMSMETFQAHVFDCFDNEADPPETLQPRLENNDRKCPMCEAVYPENVAQGDFEEHVNSHFREDDFIILRP